MKRGWIVNVLLLAVVVALGWYVLYRPADEAPQHKLTTPANWKQGDDVIIAPAVSDAEAKEKFPGGWRTAKPYLRYVQPPSA